MALAHKQRQATNNRQADAGRGKAARRKAKPGRKAAAAGGM